MKNTSMYVIMHKDAATPKKEGYISLLVGGAIGNIAKSAICRDDVGDNISEKNKSYCEMTGLYWIWKNDIESRYIGISHYRRYFTDNYFSMSIESCLSVEKIEKLFNKYDVIVPQAAVYKDTILNSLNIAPNLDDMKAVEAAIKALYPEYLGDYKSFLNGNRYYPYNMLVMKREDFEKYCEWIFNILDHVEREYGNPYTDNYHSRLFGFLSERLLYLWVNHNMEKSRIKEMKILFTEENILRSNYHVLSNFIHDISFKLRKKGK